MSIIKTGYNIGKAQEDAPSRVCMYLTPDVLEFIDDFKYKLKKKQKKLSTSELTRIAIRHFESLSWEEQWALIDD
jgi:hypothetical protein